MKEKYTKGFPKKKKKGPFRIEIWPSGPAGLLGSRFMEFSFGIWVFTLDNYTK